MSKDTTKKIGEIKEYRRKFYDERSKVYDEKPTNYKREYEKELEGFRKLVTIKNGDVVLDVATGTGNYLIEMTKMGAICYGIDISPKMLEKLRDKVKKQGLEDSVREVNVGEAERLPYSSGYFDWVTCIGMFEYYPMEYARVVLKEVRRILKLCGRCFFDVVDPQNIENQSRNYLFKFDLNAFEDLVDQIGFKVLRKNLAVRMIQYLCLAS